MSSTVLEPHVALITSGTSHLGKALSKKLSEAGYAVAIHSHSAKEKAEALAISLNEQGGMACGFQANLACEKQAKALVESVQMWRSRLDVIVHNSGVYTNTTLADLTEEEWLIGFHSTASAVFFLTRAALPLLRQSGRGRIITIGDCNCERPTARRKALGYHIGKTGVLLLTRTFAQAEAQYGITCNMVSPGYLEKSLTHPLPEAIPAGRWGKADDVWGAIHFLLQPESSYLNGSNLVVSGGWNL